MNVKTLKALLQDLPDEMPVVLVCQRESQFARQIHGTTEMIYVYETPDEGLVVLPREAGPWLRLDLAPHEPAQVLVLQPKL